MANIKQIFSDCGTDCTICNNLVELLSAEGIDLDKALSDRSAVVDLYVARYGVPSIEWGGETLGEREAIFEVRSAISDLRKVA